MSDNRPFRCPYPGCGWQPSRPAESDVPLTRAVVSHEIEKHRSQHAATDDTGGDE